MNSKRKSKRTIVLAAGIALTALLLTTAWSVVAADKDDYEESRIWTPAHSQGPEPWWSRRIAGTWIALLPPFGPLTEPAVVQHTLTPLDPAGERLAYRQQWINADPTFMSMYPEADYQSDLVGVAVRTGLNTYEYHIVGYGVKSQPSKRGKVQFIWVTSGTATIIDRDTMELTDVYLAVFSPDKDVDPADGLPDEGAEPDLCLGPMESPPIKRVRLMPPCVPPPAAPEG